jgi:hypothetical protein
MGGSPAIWNQDHYLWEANDNTDNDLLTPLASEDTTYETTLDTPLILRFKLSNVGAMNLSNMVVNLQQNIDGAGYVDVDDVSTGMRAVDGLPANGAANQAENLTAIGGTTYIDGEYDDSNGSVTLSLKSDESVEISYCIEARSADLSGGESIDFRVDAAGFTVDNFFQTPNLTTTANTISQLPSNTLTLTKFDPTVIGDFDPNHISELPSKAFIVQHIDTEPSRNHIIRGPITVFGEDGNIAYIDSDRPFSGGNSHITVDPTDWDEGGTGVQEGDLMVFHIKASATPQTVTDDNGSTPFTEQFRSDDPGSATCEYTIWTRFVGPSEPATYHFLKSNIVPFHDVMIRVYRNVNPNDIFDIAPIIGNADFGLDLSQVNDLTAPSITTTDPDSMAVMWVHNDGTTGDEHGGHSYTAGWNLTRNGTNPSDTTTNVSSEKFMPSAGATGDFVVTTTNTITNAWLGIQYALKKALPQVSLLPSDSLVLDEFDPQVVVTTGGGEVSELPSDTLALDDFDPQAVTTEKHISLLPSDTLALADFDPTFETFDPNTSELSSDVLALADFDPQSVTTEKHISQLAQAAVVLAAFAPQAITTENNVSQLEPETLVIADFDPQAVTTEKHISLLPSVTLVLDEFDPTIVVAASNFSQLESETLSLADFDPQAVTTEKHISNLPSDTLTLADFNPTFETFDPNTSQLEGETLVLTNYAPEAVTTEGADADVSQLPSQVLSLADFDPQAITTEKHISLLPSNILTLADFDPQVIVSEGFDNFVNLPFDTLALADFDPQAVTTENVNPNTSNLPSDTLVLDDFDPQAVTTENTNPNTSQLPSDTLSLVGFDPQAITTEKRVSELPFDTLSLADFDPQAVTTEKHVSLLPSGTLTLGDFDPQAVTTEKHISELPSDTLSLTGFDPQAVTTEVVSNTSELPFDTLTLNDFDPQVVASDNDISLLPFDTLSLTGFDPQAITTEKNVSQLPSVTLALTDFNPTVVSTGAQDSILPSAAFVLADFDPTFVTTETTNPNTSQIDSGAALVLTGFAPIANVSDPNTSQLPFDTLSLADFDPQITTTEVTNPNTSQLPAQTLVLKNSAIQAFVSGTDQNDVLLSVANLSLSTNAPQVTASRRILIIT